MRSLRLLPRPLARLVYRAGAKAIALYNRLVHPRVRGAAVIVRCGDRILLVRSTYQSWWSLPGGRVERGEEPVAAAARELWEEADLSVAPSALRALGDLHVEHNNIHDHVSFFELRCEREPAVACDGAEIAELRWVREQDLRTRKLWPPLAVWMDQGPVGER